MHNTFNKQRETKQKQNVKETTFSNFPCFLLFLSFLLVSFCGFAENSISLSNCIFPQTIPNDLPTTESLALSLLTKRERYTRMLAWLSVIAMQCHNISILPHICKGTKITSYILYFGLAYI